MPRYMAMPATKALFLDPAFSGRTASDIWRERVCQAPNETAFTRMVNGKWSAVTWQEADSTARAVAAGLVEMGVERGASVCILSQTRLEWVFCDVALVLAGAVSVPIYPSCSIDQCAFIIRDSGARFAFVENAAQLTKLQPLLTDIQDLRLVYMDASDAQGDQPHNDGGRQIRLADVLAAHPRHAPAPISLDDLRQLGQARRASAAELEQRIATVSPDDTFTIIYTSGTTGRPKGVVLTHKNLVSSFESAIRAFDLRDTDAQYLFLPLAHVLGRELEWAPIIVGSQIAFTAGLTRIKTDLAEVRPTFMAGVPRIFEKMHAGVLAAAESSPWPKRALVRWAFAVGQRHAAAKRKGERPSASLRVKAAVADKLVLSKLRARLGLDRCRFLISGGAPLAPEIAEFFHGLGLLVLEGYGLTETTAAAFVNRLNRFRFGTVGPAIDIIEYKLAEDGELLLRGPSIFSGYHDDPAATAEAIDAGGWFRTGDVGTVDDGLLSIIDRKKDIIVTAGGKKVAPQMIETALKLHCPLVSQVVVFGDKRPHCVALLTLSEAAVEQYGAGLRSRAAVSPELRAVLDQAWTAVNGNLAAYETIRKFTVLSTEFSEAAGELTPSLKVKRDVVASRYTQVIDALYERPA